MSGKRNRSDRDPSRIAVVGSPLLPAILTLHIHPLNTKDTQRDHNPAQHPFLLP